MIKPLNGSLRHLKSVKKGSGPDKCIITLKMQVSIEKNFEPFGSDYK